MKILPEDTREFSRQLEALPDPTRVLLLPRVLLTALHRFASTRSIEGRVRGHANRVRYGIRAARRGAVDDPVHRLARFHRSDSSEPSGESAKPWLRPTRPSRVDIGGVTQSLGVAFNSTLIALLLSIVLMFVVHQLQLQQERLVLDTETYADQELIRHLRVQ